MRTYNIYPRGGTGPLAVKARLAQLADNLHNEVNARALRVEQPIISPDGGTHVGLAVVTLSTTTPLATIYYTIDGSYPDFNSPIYLSSFAVSTNTTVRVVAYLAGFVTSQPALANFTII